MKRPGVVTFIACLFFLVAGANLVTAVIYGNELSQGQRPDSPQTLRALIVNLIMAPVLLTLGLGLWRLREWARKGTFIVCGLLYLWIIVFNLQKLLERGNVQPLEWLGLLIGLGVYIVILGLPALLLNSATVKSAFQGEPKA
ncbi:MAG TPA: hypothetical protein VNA16_06405 [Abditibacteriaceae bacterium]|nr:hypothetical protein [Abditibacteriaceae bacterium]